MGKYKSRRYKLHASAPSKKKDESKSLEEKTTTGISVPEIDVNIFDGIDVSSLLKDAPTKPFDDDTRSVKSYVSSRSTRGENVIPKKEKRKLKRQFLLQRIDTVNQLKKGLKKKKKGKEQIESFGTMQNLLDSLPVLESTVNIGNNKQSGTHHIVRKKRAIDKSRKIQKKNIQNVNIYKKILKNPALKKDPFATISEHIKAVVEKDRKAINEPNKNVAQKK